MNGLAKVALRAAMLAGLGSFVPPAVAAPGNTDAEALVPRTEQGWFTGEWADWKSRFLSPEGRVIDNGNNGVSHSEGQGYGLLLAALAGDRDGFARIWAWSDQHLFVRPDGLAAWRWDPRAEAVTDANNATDGDLLIAWALARGATAFAAEPYRVRAAALARAIGRTLVFDTPDGPALRPGAFGFGVGDQPDGPLVNLSYFVFPALDALTPLAPDVPFGLIRATGLRLVAASRFGPRRLPADWLSLAEAHPQPARNFPATFGYDAIRLPLYLAWIGSPEAQSSRFAALGAPERPTGPMVIDLKSGAPLRPIDGAGFRLVGALSHCLARDEALAPALLKERDSFYYPATLRLLTMALIAERYPECL